MFIRDWTDAKTTDTTDKFLVPFKLKLARC
jgi:hypothetical protein